MKLEKMYPKTYFLNRMSSVTSITLFIVGIVGSFAIHKGFAFLNLAAFPFILLWAFTSDMISDLEKREKRRQEDQAWVELENAKERFFVRYALDPEGERICHDTGPFSPRIYRGVRQTSYEAAYADVSSSFELGWFRDKDGTFHSTHGLRAYVLPEPKVQA